jgi:hypothetical protein
MRRLMYHNVLDESMPTDQTVKCSWGRKAVLHGEI